jgi:hypothetical protein
MINPEVQLDAADVARCFRTLRQTEPELVKAFRKDMQVSLKPAAVAIAQKYPSEAYLSNLKYNASESWSWSNVVGKVSITPGNARKGGGRNYLVSLRMAYQGAIPYVTDMFGQKSEGRSPQGKALYRNIQARFAGWPKGGRIFYKEFMEKREVVMRDADRILGEFCDAVSKELS